MCVEDKAGTHAKVKRDGKTEKKNEHKLTSPSAVKMPDPDKKRRPQGQQKQG